MTWRLVRADHTNRHCKDISKTDLWLQPLSILKLRRLYYHHPQRGRTCWELKMGLLFHRRFPRTAANLQASESGLRSPPRVPAMWLWSLECLWTVRSEKANVPAAAARHWMKGGSAGRSCTCQGPRVCFSGTRHGFQDKRCLLGVI